MTSESRPGPIEPSVHARASVVNRTHRIVRERARTLQLDRSKIRGLLPPMILCSILMVTLCVALWMLLDQYDLVSSELPAASHHFLLISLWFLPVSAVLGVMVGFRRSRNEHDARAEAIQ